MFQCAAENLNYVMMCLFSCKILQTSASVCASTVQPIYTLHTHGNNEKMLEVIKNSPEKLCNFFRDCPKSIIVYTMAPGIVRLPSSSVKLRLCETPLPTSDPTGLPHTVL